MTDKMPNLTGQYTQCLDPRGERKTLFASDTAHVLQLKLYGQCGLCKQRGLYQGEREYIVTKLATEILHPHFYQTDRIDDDMDWEPNDYIINRAEVVREDEGIEWADDDMIPNYLALILLRQGLEQAIQRIDDKLASLGVDPE